MRAIHAAEVVCDLCGRRLVRLAAPLTPDTQAAQRDLLSRLQALAVSKRWQLEGPFAEDLCPPCRAQEHAA